MVFKTEEELQAYTDWTKGQLENMAQHVRNSDLFQDEVMGHAVWTLPHKLFIGKAWSRSDRNRAYWIISGVDIPSDHIDLAVADTAREAARHFVMKWQLQSAWSSSARRAMSRERKTWTGSRSPRACVVRRRGCTGWWKKKRSGVLPKARCWLTPEPHLIRLTRTDLFRPSTLSR